MRLLAERSSGLSFSCDEPFTDPRGHACFSQCSAGQHLEPTLAVGVQSVLQLV
jgi:hypothetical protein